MRKALIAVVVAACGGHNSGSGTPDTACFDNDGDGQTTCAGDCDDSDPTVYAGGPEICGDGKDNNCDGQIDENCNGLGTFVSTATGDDANAGTQAAPVKTIAKGMANAMTIGGPQGVYVAGGHYTEKITLVEGISLLGGYDCSAQPCTWTRDPTMFDTAILDTDLEGVLAPATITRATTLDGFRVVGFSTNATTGFGAAISVSGAPWISHDRVVGGTITGNAQSVAIAVLAPTTGTPLITSDDITLGTSAGLTTGIDFTAVAFPVAGPATAEVRANTIHGGTGHDTAGIMAGTSGAGTLITNNTIVSGTSSASGSSLGAAWGIRGFGVATIDSNHINTPPATPGTCVSGDWCGGIESESSNFTITNNVVYGAGTPRSVALRLREVEAAARTVIVNSNYLDGGGVAPIAGGQSMSAAVQLEYVACNSCGANAVMGRLRNNILVAGRATLRYDVLENDTTNSRTNRPEALENNVFWIPTPAGANDVLYHQWNGTVGLNLVTIVQVNAILTPPAVKNQNADPMDDATWHLMAGSPAIDTGTATEAPATDMDGAARPNGAGYDIGPDEM